MTYKTNKKKLYSGKEEKDKAKKESEGSRYYLLQVEEKVHTVTNGNPMTKNTLSKQTHSQPHLFKLPHSSLSNVWVFDRCLNQTNIANLANSLKFG